MLSNALSVGDAAPNFKRTDISGKSVTLSDFADSYTLIAFLRRADCPWCNLAIHRLSVEEQVLRDNRCKIITFIQSSEKDIALSVVEKHETTPQFPIIADPEMEIYRKYHVQPSLINGLKHHLLNAPAWLTSVYKNGNGVGTIDSMYFLAPAAILVSPGDQKILRADYTADLYDHDAITSIYNSLNAHQMHSSLPML